MTFRFGLAKSAAASKTGKSKPMPDLLLELRSEEIPARMQRKAAGDLRKMVTDALVEAGLTYEGAREYWTPRRLTLDIRGLTARSADIREEKKGPAVSAPQPAIDGFLRGAGLTSIEQAAVKTDPKKGDFYVAYIEKPGRAAEDIIRDVMPGIIRSFPWPKSMRSGAASMPKGSSYGGIEGRGSESLRWVRPLQSIVCLSGRNMTRRLSSPSRSTASPLAMSPTDIASMRPMPSPCVASMTT